MDTITQAQPDNSSRTQQLDVEHADHTPAPQRRGGPRRALTATLLGLGLAAGVAPAAHIAATDTPARPLGGCTLTPTANSMPSDVTALLTTVRINEGTIEMLHDASCTDGRTGTVWIAGDVI
jgi:hypothetical protein